MEDGKSGAKGGKMAGSKNTKAGIQSNIKSPNNPRRANVSTTPKNSIAKPSLVKKK